MYPTEITDEVLSNVSHVTNETIKTDIADTQAEIISLEKEVAGYKLIADAFRVSQRPLSGLNLQT